MKIRNIKKKTQFREIEVSDVFFKDDEYFMKIESVLEKENVNFLNAVNLTTGECCFFQVSEMVEKINCELVII